MIAYHVEVPAFQMVFGEATGNDTRVLVRVEYDVAHNPFGWHVHSFCDDVSLISLGMMKPFGQRRIPIAGAKHRRASYTLKGDSMSDNMALEIASKWFRFPYQTSLGID
jgi:hypothetical protein